MPQATSLRKYRCTQDQEVRQGLKEYSHWPTFPQLYVGGQLFGGCDIICEYLQQNQLKQEIVAQLKDSKSNV